TDGAEKLAAIHGYLPCGGESRRIRYRSDAGGFPGGGGPAGGRAGRPRAGESGGARDTPRGGRSCHAPACRRARGRLAGGARRAATPTIDRLALEGAWAPQADVHVPLTRPSHASLFTGRYPAEHGVRDNVSAPLAADVPLLAEAFQRAGWRTAAFLASTVLDRQSGLARGFDVYSDRFEDGADRRTGDRGGAEAAAWLKGKPRFFAWVHLYDPHAPYTPPEPYASRYAGRPYDGTVAWSDELVGRLLASLRDAGTLDGTLVVVTSDH